MGILYVYFFWFQDVSQVNHTVKYAIMWTLMDLNRKTIKKIKKAVPRLAQSPSLGIHDLFGSASQASESKA